MKDYRIGDEIVLYNSIFDEKMKFIIIGIDHKQKDTVTLLTKEIEFIYPFDNDLLNNISNNYKNSNILRILNMILDGFEEDVSRHIVTSHNPTIVVDDSTYENKRCHVEDVECKITLLSKTEVGLEGEYGLNEGEVFPYFKEYKREAAIIDNFFNTIYYRYWLRTPNPDTDNYQGYISKYGTYESIDVDNTHIGVRFAMTVNKKLLEGII